MASRVIPKRGRPRGEWVVVECAYCGKKEERRKCDLKRNKTGRFFCNRTCQGKLGVKPRRGVERICKQCGVTKFYVGPNETKELCGRECMTAWNSRNAVERTCAGCGVLFHTSESVPQLYHDRACYEANRIFRTDGRIHNGRPVRIDKRGYILIYEPGHPNAYKGGWIPEHRWVVSQALGRPLTRAEVVHHDNRVKADNALRNLMLLSASEHTRAHVENLWRLNKRLEREMLELQERMAALEAENGALRLENEALRVQI